MSCIACVAGFHLECYQITDEAAVSTIVQDYHQISCCCPKSEKIPVARGGPTKADEDVTDPESTGRKRAAQLFPLTPNMPCEWRGLREAGGGSRTIIGCVSGIATNRHHGPDKNTLNNEVGNVHRICPTCHNRWHALNDPNYKNGKQFPGQLPHRSDITATPEEILKNELWWKDRPEYRAKEE